jgi:hypothetical protein
MRRFLVASNAAMPWQPGTMREGSDMRRVVALAGFVLTLAVAPVLFAQAARAETTVAFQAKFKESFGIAASKPCDHFVCGTGTVVGFGEATAFFDLTSFTPPIEGTNCGLFTGDQTITLVGDGSTLLLEISGTVCFPGNTFEASMGNGDPLRGEATFTIKLGTGVFDGATGGGTNESMGAGDQAHDTFSGTLTLP